MRAFEKYQQPAQRGVFSHMVMRGRAGEGVVMRGRIGEGVARGRVSELGDLQGML